MTYYILMTMYAVSSVCPGPQHATMIAKYSTLKECSSAIINIPQPMSMCEKIVCIANKV